MLLPTDRRVVEALEVFMHHAPQGASEDPQSPPSPQAVLTKYFDTSSTTPTLLLYHLEVRALALFTPDVTFNPLNPSILINPLCPKAAVVNPFGTGCMI